MTAPWNRNGCSDWLEMWAPRLKPHNVFKVAFIIARHADEETGECDLSIKTIAEMCGMAASDVHAAISRLPEIGCIHVEPGKQGAGHRNAFRLLADPGEVEAYKERLKARRKALREEMAARREEYTRRKATASKEAVAETKPAPAKPNGNGNGVHIPRTDAEIEDWYWRVREQEERNFLASQITIGSS
jgi:hypothetical protein